MSDLAKLKDQVLDELVKVTDEEGLNSQEKFDLVMTRYVNTGDEALLSDALIAAKAIEDVAGKGQALMQLLEEIDIAQLDALAEQKQPQLESQEESSTEQSISIDG